MLCYHAKHYQIAKHLWWTSQFDSFLLPYKHASNENFVYELDTRCVCICFSWSQASTTHTMHTKNGAFSPSTTYHTAGILF